MAETYRNFVSHMATVTLDAMLVRKHGESCIIPADRGLSEEKICEPDTGKQFIFAKQKRCWLEVFLTFQSARH